MPAPDPSWTLLGFDGQMEGFESANPTPTNWNTHAELPPSHLLSPGNPSSSTEDEPSSDEQITCDKCGKKYSRRCDYR
jgi:hypothetical protein